MANQIVNGAYVAPAKWPDDKPVTVAPESGEAMPTAKREDLVSAVVKQILAAAIAGAMAAAGTMYVSSARAEERLASVQRELSAARDKLELEAVRTQKLNEKVLVLEAQMKTAEELGRLNDNLDRILGRRR